MRNSLSFYGITADDLKAGGGARVGLYVNPDNAIGFGYRRCACCAARLPGAELFACTLAANHDGDHAAGESGVRWPR